MENACAWFVVAVLAVWRVTQLLVAEDGPGRVLVRLRASLGNGFWGTAFGCFNCMSLWIAAPFAIGLGSSWAERAALWLALSGAACLLERIGQRTGTSPPAVFFEGHKEEHAHELLRRRTSGNDSTGGC